MKRCWLSVGFRWVEEVLMREYCGNLVVVLSLIVALFGFAAPAAESAPAAGTFAAVGAVTAILPDGDVLWAGTRGGDLVRLDPHTGLIERFPSPAQGLQIRGLARDGRGHIWAATAGGGLGRFDGRSWAIFTPENSPFPSFDVRTVLVDDAERVWAGTSAGVACLDGGHWTVYNNRNSGLVSDDVSALAVGYQVWIGTDRGLSVLGQGDWRAGEWSVFQTSNSPLPHDRITALALDQSRRLWVGSEKGAAWTRDGSEWWTDDAIAGPVSAILPGADGSLWLNTGGSVGHYSPCRWVTYDGRAFGLDAATIDAVALNARGRLWAGGESGIAMLDPDGERGSWTSTGIDQPVSAMAALGSDLWLVSGGAAAKFDPRSGESTLFLPEYGLGALVRSAAADEQGRVWFATWGHGLTVFDGQGWEVYTTANSPLPSDFVSAVLPLPGGGVLFGTSAGLAALDRGEWRSYDAADLGFTQAQMSAVAAAADGRIAVSATGGGVSVYDGHHWTAYSTLDSGIPSDYVQTMAYDRSGALWIGTQGSGVARWDGTRWSTFTAGPSGPGGNFVQAFAVGPDGTLWVGTEGGGLSSYDGCTWVTYEPTPGDAVPANVYALHVDNEGRVWLGTERGLFAFMPPASLLPVTPPPERRVLQSFPAAAPVAGWLPAMPADNTSDRWTTHGVGRSVHRIAFAGEDIWAATRFGGAVRWDAAGGFTRFQYPQDGIGGNEVVFTAVDPLGRTWCATLGRGVSVYDGAGWTVYNTENSGLPHDNVNGVAFGKSGEVWVATLGGGVAMFDGREWTVFDTANSSIAGDYVWYVDVDARGRLWCGCMEGLSVYDGHTWYTYPDTYNVHCVAYDSQGRTWFGDGMGLNRVDGADVVDVSREQLDTYTRDVYAIAFATGGVAWLATATGIYRYDGASLVHYSAAVTGLAGKQVFAASVGPDGRVWFGTDGEDGIASFDGISWTNYSTAAGPNPVGTDVVASFVDAGGRVWLGTDWGVSVFDGRTWTGYTLENSGLGDRRVQAIAQDPQGRMWFGTPRGISVFDGLTWLDVLPIPDKAGPVDRSVEAILFDAKGRAWVGGAEGVSVFDGGVWRTFTPENSALPNQGITTLAVDHQGRIWAGSWQLGDIGVFDGTQWEAVSREQYGLDAWWVSAIAVDARGSVWIGTDEGVSVFDGAAWSPLPAERVGEDYYSVSSIVFDAAGRTWFGYYGGVSRLDASGWVHYTPSSSPLAAENVLTLAVDGAGHVWIGAVEGGASELIPGATRFKMPATPTPVPTPAPYVPPDTPAPTPVPTATLGPDTASQVTGQEPAGFFADVWKQAGGGEGSLGWVVAPERLIFCAEQRFEHGYMFWRNEGSAQSVIYVLTYDQGTHDEGSWQSVADTWDETQPVDSGLTPPAGLHEPGRGFGKAWRALSNEDSFPPSLGWAVENEQGLEDARYQDFTGATMVFSPRLNRVLVLGANGHWRAVARQPCVLHVRPAMG